MIRILLVLLCLLGAASVASAQAQGPQAPAPQEVLGQDRLITLDEAVALALENNLGLQVERLDPAFARERVRETEGAFEPDLVLGYDRQHVETPVASSVQSFFGTSGDRTTEDYFTYNGGVQGILPWGFGYSSGYSMQKLNSDSGIYALDPQYTANWRTELVVPLLRNLYWSTPDLLVRRSRVSQDITDENFQARLTDTIALVEAAYWSLAATRALDAAALKSVDTARDLLEQTKVQYQVGVVSKVRVTEAEAGLAQREFDHIVRVNETSAAQDRLLTAILAPGISDYLSTNIRTEEPTFVPYDVNAEAALEKARALRPELAAAQLAVTNAEYDESYAWNQKLPDLNVVGSYTNTGLAGEQKRQFGEEVTGIATPGPTSVLITNPDGSQYYTNPILPRGVQPNFGFPTSRWGADNDFMSGSGEHSWGIGALLVVPIGNDTRDARYVQSKILLRRAKTNLRLQEQSIIVEVRTAVRDLESAIDGVKAAQRARIASEETLRAEQERLRLGDSTPHTVLEYDEDLRVAESSEIRALQVYRTKIAELERAQGTLLEKLRIDVVDERDRGVGEF
jgi:outer membrane protein TolC